VEAIWVESIPFQPLLILTHFTVDAFPFLKYLPKWFPGIEFHKTGERGKALALDLLMGPYMEVKSQVVCAWDDLSSDSLG